MVRGGSKGGWGASAPLQLVHQWKYEEGEGEEEVEERRKMEREREEEEETSPPFQSCSAFDNHEILRTRIKRNSKSKNLTQTKQDFRGFTQTCTESKKLQRLLLSRIRIL